MSSKPPSEDAVVLLTQQHRQLEGLLRALTQTQSAEARTKALATAGDELLVHVASEENVFYPAVHASRTEDILLESLEEHLSLKRLLADLLALAPDDTTFEPKCKVLREQAEHHHQEEEENLFPKVQQRMNDEARIALGREMLQLQGDLRAQGRPRDAVMQQTEAAEPLAKG